MRAYIKKVLAHADRVLESSISIKQYGINLKHWYLHFPKAFLVQAYNSLPSSIIQKSPQTYLCIRSHLTEY